MGCTSAVYKDLFGGGIEMLLLINRANVMKHRPGLAYRLAFGKVEFIIKTKRCKKNNFVFK